jgi:hypothetical protein
VHQHEGHQGYQLLTEVKNGASMSSLFFYIVAFHRGCETTSHGMESLALPVLAQALDALRIRTRPVHRTRPDTNGSKFS